MTHKSKPDWCVFAGILAAAAALWLHVGYWIAGPVLLILLLCAYPQSYETGPEELVIYDSLTRRRIPYSAILSAQPDGRHVRIQYGLASEIVISPADSRAFLRDVAARAPQGRYVEYSFIKARGAWRTS